MNKGGQYESSTSLLLILESRYALYCCKRPNFAYVFLSPFIGILFPFEFSSVDFPLILHRSLLGLPEARWRRVTRCDGERASRGACFIQAYKYFGELTRQFFDYQTTNIQHLHGMIERKGEGSEAVRRKLGRKRKSNRKRAL
jgi:hypothetical protein